MENLNTAFDVAEKYLDIPRMLDPEGMLFGPQINFILLCFLGILETWKREPTLIIVNGHTFSRFFRVSFDVFFFFCLSSPFKSIHNFVVVATNRSDQYAEAR